MAVQLPDNRSQGQRISEYFSGGTAQERYFALLHFAERLIRSMHWCVPTSDDSMPGGGQARDVVQETVQAYLLDDPKAEGYRKLPANVAVEAALHMVIRSKINHVAEGAENIRREDHVGVDQTGEAADHLETDAVFWEPNQAKLSSHQEAFLAARCTRFIEFCRKDKPVCDMLIVIRDQGFDRPAERLAKALSVRVGEVYLVRKRLGTLLRQYLKANAS
ncbi:MAG: hypothetical protein ABIR80_17990 [Opitutaceae bacterium]